MYKGQNITEGYTLIRRWVFYSIKLSYSEWPCIIFCSQTPSLKQATEISWYSPATFMLSKNYGLCKCLVLVWGEGEQDESTLGTSPLFPYVQFKQVLVCSFQWAPTGWEGESSWNYAAIWSKHVRQSQLAYADQLSWSHACSKTNHTALFTNAGKEYVYPYIYGIGDDTVSWWEYGTLASDRFGLY